MPQQTYRHYQPAGLLSGLLQMSPGTIDLVKVIALLVMLVDHANTLFLMPARLEFYSLGRMAFPLFTFVWAMNLSHPPARLQIRANRLWLWAFLTQPVFLLAFRHTQPWYALNILFVFAAVTQLLALTHRFRAGGILAGTILLAALACPLIPASYGVPGILFAVGLAVMFAPAPARLRTAGLLIAATAMPCLNGITHLADRPLDALTVAILPTVLLPYLALRLAVSLMPAGSPRFMPSRFFYYAYAGHLLIFRLTELWL